MFCANAFLIDQLLRVLYDFAERRVYPLPNPTKGQVISLLAIAGIVVLVYRLRSGSSKPDRAVDSSVAVGQGKQADTEQPQAPSFTANGTSPGGPTNGSSATDRSASRH